MKRKVFVYSISVDVPDELEDDTQLENDAFMAASDFIETMENALSDYEGIEVRSAEMVS